MEGEGRDRDAAGRRTAAWQPLLIDVSPSEEPEPTGTAPPPAVNPRLTATIGLIEESGISPGGAINAIDQSSAQAAETLSDAAEAPDTAGRLSPSLVTATTASRLAVRQSSHVLLAKCP